MAQELLFTFGEDLGALSLVPDDGGVFRIQMADGTVLYDRSANDGKFPESKELKQLVRDAIAPGKDLGHSDKD
jgi:selenoprotein W-related protein